MGVVYEECRRVYLVPSASDRVVYSTQLNQYLLRCYAPCGLVSSFQKRMLKPYSVTETAASVGYAEFGEYQLLEFSHPPEAGS
jgi:hypothetical protein